MRTDRMQRSDQISDVLWRVALVALGYKRLDLAPGNAPEVLGAERGQKIVTHDTPDDPSGGGLTGDSNVVSKPLLGIVCKRDRLGSCVQKSHISQGQFRFQLPLHLLSCALAVADTLGFTSPLVVN